MADNNDLKVIVGLNIPQSVVEIEDDLKIIEKTLANNDKGKLKITAGLNVGKTIGIINKQLSELKIDGSRLKITPTLDISVGNQMAQQVNDQVNSAFSQIDFKHIAREIRDLLNIKKNSGIKEITKDIQTMYESFNVNPDKYKESFNNILNWYQARSDDFILTEEEKVKQLNDLLSQLYNAPDRLTTLPKIATYTKDNPLIVTTRTLEEMKTILGNMEEVKRLFGEVQVDDVNGKLIGSFGQDWKPKEAADALRVYIEYLQKIQELRGRNRLTLDEYRSKDDNEIWINQIEEAILKQYKFIEVSNRVAQSNEQVAQSQRDIAQAQREVQSAGGDQLSFNDQKTAENLEKTKELSNELIQGEKELVNLEKERTEIQNRLNQNKDAFKMAFEFDDDYDKLESAIKKDEDSLKKIEQEITNKTSANKVIKDQIEELSNQLREESQKINQSTQNMGSAGGNGVGTSSEYLSSNTTQIKAFADSAKDAEQKYKDLLVSMGDTKGTVVSKEFADATGDVNSFIVAVKSGTGALETFRYVVDEENDGFKLDNITAANAGVEKLRQSTEKYKATVEATIKTSTAFVDKLKADWSDENGGRSVKDAEHVADLNKKYDELIKTINSLRDADNIAAKDISANIKVQKTQLSSLITAYHNAEKVATSLRAKDTDSSIINTKNNIQKFMNELGASKVPFSSIHDELEKLALAMQELDKAASGDKASKLREVLNAFDNVKSKFDLNNTIARNFDDVDTKVKTLITDLNKINNAQIFKTHGADSDVVAFRNEIEGLSTEAKDFKAQLDALSQSGTKVIPDSLRNQINDLIAKFESAKQKNLQLQDGLRDNDAWSQISSRVQTLTARIKEYMAVNTKAAKKYSGQFEGILSDLSNAEINKDIESVKRLTSEFQILKSQIRAAGDQGKTFGQTLVDNIKKFSSWLSLTSLVMRAWHSLKQMVTTVRELDTAMTALKRVTDETESSYANFLKSVQTRAVELHTTMTDLIDQITTWSKLGYGLNEAQNLAQVSMMYSKVGDVDNETAVKDLVATMKAYNMTAEESIRIVDMLDVLNNKYAVSAKDLGAGLSRVASAMAVSNTSLEKSLSLITGGAEITQDAENIATALKVINARIRGMKGQLQELGEEYENIESISKIQTQILNLSGVNIFDANRNFRDTYDILEDIAKVYKELSDEQSSSLLEILFGKNRYNQGVAILQAFESGQIQKALNDATNSVGVATEEWSKYEKSIDASVASFNAMKQALSSEIFNSQDLKNIVDFGTNALGVLKDIISQFGVLQTLLPVIFGALSAFKNVGRAKMSALKMEYADCNVVVTRNELMIA